MYGIFDHLLAAILTFGAICFVVGAAAFWFFGWLFSHLHIVVRWI